jgi:hypothetical protein
MSLTMRRPFAWQSSSSMGSNGNGAGSGSSGGGGFASAAKVRSLHVGDMLNISLLQSCQPVSGHMG